MRPVHRMWADSLSWVRACFALSSVCRTVRMSGLFTRASSGYLSRDPRRASGLGLPPHGGGLAPRSAPRSSVGDGRAICQRVRRDPSRSFGDLVKTFTTGRPELGSCPRGEDSGGTRGKRSGGARSTSDARTSSAGEVKGLDRSFAKGPSCSAGTARRRRQACDSWGSLYPSFASAWLTLAQTGHFGRKVKSR
jgi:hypothetical protein